MLLLNLIDFLFLNTMLLLILLMFNLDNGFSILIISEGCWIVLYIIYVLCGIYSTILTPVSISLIILVLAAIDCSIWVLILVYSYRMRYDVTVDNSMRDLKFLYRSNRLLRENRYIR